MSVTTLREALEKRNIKCPTCNEKHHHQAKCNRGDLVFRIENLLKANSLIPQMMNATKEAVATTTEFQNILKKVDEAHTILMEVLTSHGDIGEKIKAEYLGRIDAWVNPTTSLDTAEEQLHLFDSGTQDAT